MIFWGIIMVLLIIGFVLACKVDRKILLFFLFALLFFIIGVSSSLLFPDTDYSDYKYTPEQLSELQVGKETRITDITDLQVATLIDENKEEGKCQISYMKDGDSTKINVDKKNIVVFESETGKPYIIKSKVKKDATTMEKLFNIFVIFDQKDTVYQVFE